MKALRGISLLLLLLFSGLVFTPQKALAETALPETTVLPGMTAAPEEASPLSGLQFDETSFPPMAVGQGVFPLEVEAFQGLYCKWESETPEYATVDRVGRVRPVKTGQAVIRVTVTDLDGKEYTFRIPLRIVNPHLGTTPPNLASGCQTTLEVRECSGEPVACYSPDKKKITYVSQENGNVVIKAGKKLGTVRLILEADGVQMLCKITVTNPRLKTSYCFLEKKKGFRAVVSGTNKKSELLWETSDKSVATVNQSGCGRTKKTGSAVVTCRVDGKVLSYYVAVGKKTVIKAIRWGYKRLGKCRYSQVLRMRKKYFDCSSFVYRCYRTAGKYLVRKTSWAPVAADIGRYYVQKKKRVKPSGSSYKPSKLLPGDLICFGGKKAKRNGRYQRIYHIALYIGNGKTIESSSTYNNVVIRDRGVILKKYVPVVVRPV